MKIGSLFSGMRTTPYWSNGQATIWHANALDLPLEDESVDLICTSPPYFSLRSYQDECLTCRGKGRAERPDSHGMKVCPDCGNVADRKRCNKCGASMKWPPRSRRATPSDCPDCDGSGRVHYQDQIGSEATPAEFVDALIAATREMVRVLKPTGSIFVNLGDKYAGGGGQWEKDERPDPGRRRAVSGKISTGGKTYGFRTKSLMLIPERYRIACVDQLGLIARAVVVWSKPNGLPESVTDRVRRSHEDWIHLTKQPRYYSAVDEIREAQASLDRKQGGPNGRSSFENLADGRVRNLSLDTLALNPLGKLPGSVWTIPTQPLRVPPELGVDHFAAFPMEWPRRIITGWSPRDVCTACGEGRRPVVQKTLAVRNRNVSPIKHATDPRNEMPSDYYANTPFQGSTEATITGYACACTPYTDHEGTGDTGHHDATTNAYTMRTNGEPRETTHPGHAGLWDRPRSGSWREYHFDRWTPAPTTPGVVADPFGGTGTVSLVASVLGRDSHYVDLSADYCRLAKWRITDPGEIARAMQVEKPPKEIDGQDDLLTLIETDGAA